MGGPADMVMPAAGPGTAVSSSATSPPPSSTPAGCPLDTRAARADVTRRSKIARAREPGDSRNRVGRLAHV